MNKERFDKENYHSLCDEVAANDPHLAFIIAQFGYPPWWVRPNTFATLVLTILEQQVSLASAYAAFTKLTQKLKIITPQKLLLLSDEDLRQCYFSRQKIGYVRGLAVALKNNQINLEKLADQPDSEVRKTLKTLKGIGDWTVDIYLLHALQRVDVFPIGDLALVKAMKEIKELPTSITKEDFIKAGEQWRPYRSIATMILWHYYLSKRRPNSSSKLP